VEGSEQAVISSAQEFLELRFSEDPELYRRAANEAAPDEVWLELVEQHPGSRFWVAQNKTVPLAVLKRLAADEDSRVRGMVAMKRKLDEETFRLLAADPDAGVRMSIARNAKTPAAVLKTMLNDPWDEVPAVVRQRLASS
jgi:hypothetical protein